MFQRDITNRFCFNFIRVFIFYHTKTNKLLLQHLLSQKISITLLILTRTKSAHDVFPLSNKEQHSLTHRHNQRQHHEEEDTPSPHTQSSLLEGFAQCEFEKFQI